MNNKNQKTFQNKGCTKIIKSKSFIITLFGLMIAFLLVLIIFLLNIFNLSVVENFKAETITNNSVVLTWDHNKFSNQYVLYRSEIKENGKHTPLKQCATVFSNSFKDQNLNQATKYYYKIYACVSFNDSLLSKSPPKELFVTTYPSVINNFKANKISTNNAIINWDRNPKATSYIIQRSKETNNKKFSSFKTIKIIKNRTSFTDKNLSSGTFYRYSIKAKVNNIIGPAANLKIFTKLDKPSVFEKIKSTLTKIKLQWTKVKNANEYELYRNNRLIKTLSDSSFVDSSLKSGNTYTYAVRAIRIENNKYYKSKFNTIKTSTNIKVPTVPGGLSGTWVEINIDNQYMKMFVDSKLYIETPVVTGNIYGHSTTKGHHEVISMSSPSRLKGDTWDIMVDYWMGFTYDGQGIHDSSWRSEYGGTIYMGNGSHGCVNTPYDVVKKMYSMAYIGMPVIIY